MWKHSIAVVVFAAAMPVLAADEAEPAGETIVKKRCVVCHDMARLQKIAARTPEADRAARWEKFLPTHNVGDAAQRKVVIEYLLTATK